jgi:hypothetical protein
MIGIESTALRRPSPCEPFGEFDDGAPIGGILDVSKGNDEPQAFDDVQIDLIIAKQLQ